MGSKSARIEEIEEEDVISQLDDKLIIEILSLLPEADAKQTRLVSKSWKNHWAFLPSLRFVMPNGSSIEEANKFHDFVDRTLALRRDTQVQKFSLSLSKGWNYDRVDDWLCKVVPSKLQELELSFGDYLDDAARFRWHPWHFMNTSTTLVNLTLRGDLLLLLPDGEFYFPCLKKIDIRWVVVLCVGHTKKFYGNLISGCPVLQDLFLEEQKFQVNESAVTLEEVYPETCVVSSQSLKRLRLISIRGRNEFVLDVPELEYLSVCDVSSTSLSMAPSLSLMEAHITANPNVVAHLLPCLSSVKILTLGGFNLVRLSDVDGLNIPVFPNLVKFSVGRVSGRGWNMLWSLLGNMPNLEHITFLDGPFPSLRARYMFHIDWPPAEEVPACLQFKMKEITVLNRETIAQEEFESLRYLLEHSNSLETVTINAHEIDAVTREQILNFRRGSSSCRIQFV